MEIDPRIIDYGFAIMIFALAGLYLYFEAKIMMGKNDEKK